MNPPMTTNTDTQAHGGGVETPSVHDQAGALLVHLSGIPMVEWVWSDAEMIFAFLSRVLAASPAAPAAAGVDAQFTALRVAYKRGVAWSIENPGANSSLVEKAAYDYADKATSVALIDEHLTPDFADDGNCCAGKHAAPDAKGER